MQIFERDFLGGRWYRLLPVVKRSVILPDMLCFKWLSIK